MDNDNMELTVVQLNGCVFFSSLSGSVIIIGYFMKFTVAAPRPNIFSVHFDSGISSRQFQILVSLEVFEKLNDIGNNGARLKKNKTKKYIHLSSALCGLLHLNLQKDSVTKTISPQKNLFHSVSDGAFLFDFFL